MICIDLSNKNVTELYNIYCNICSINTNWRLSDIISLTENDIKFIILNNEGRLIAHTTRRYPDDITIVGINPIIELTTLCEICDSIKSGDISDFTKEVRSKQNVTPNKVFDLDEILEKIHKNGLTSLTKEEKDFLDKSN